MLSLPRPVSGGSLVELRQFINVSDEHYPLVLAWLIAALRPTGPYPILCLHGEQGSGKSSQARMLRSLIDPNIAPLRSEPKDARDLMIAANNGWVLGLDNLSYIKPELSDALCRLSTGGGFSTRMLFENDEEMIFDAMRPMIITGIEEIATRGDLIDRSLLAQSADNPRRPAATRSELLSEFDAVRPRVFRTCWMPLPVLSEISLVHKVRPPPRMADFALGAPRPSRARAIRWRLLTTYQHLKPPTKRCSNRRPSSSTSSNESKAVDFPANQGNCWMGSNAWADGHREKNAGILAEDPEVVIWNAQKVAPNLRQSGIDVDFDRTSKPQVDDHHQNKPGN